MRIAYMLPVQNSDEDTYDEGDGSSPIEKHPDWEMIINQKTID